MSIGLPPKPPSVTNGASQENRSNKERPSGIDRTPQISSERYWGNFTMKSHERLELERLVDATRMAIPNSGRSQPLHVLKDDSLFMKELDKFLIQSHNESDYIIIDRKTSEVVDVLTQRKMRKLIPDSGLLNKKLKEGELEKVHIRNLS